MRKVTLILPGFAIAALSFLAGRWWGSSGTSDKLMREEIIRWDQRAALDRSVLQSFPVRSNTMVSGTYLMDVWFPNSKLPTREVVLECEHGEISAAAFSRNRERQKLSVDGSVIYWSQEGAGYEADAKYVGLVDGGEMWGRVYGWNPGDQSVGLWRVYPKPSHSDQTDGARIRSQSVRPETNRVSATAGSAR